MLRFIVAALLLVIASSPASAQATTATPATGQRASAERLFETWVQECGGPSESRLKQLFNTWPSNQRFRIQFHTFFADTVDDRLAGELEANERRLLLGALTPLGLTVDALGQTTAGARASQSPVVDIGGLGEALRPQADVPGIYTGAAWKGMFALRDGDRCLAAIPFSASLRPPDALASVAYDDPAAAPYLEALEASVLEPIVRLVEALQGETGLSRLAMSEADWRLRTGAVDRLKNQSWLMGIARGAKAPWLRAAAVGKLTSQAALDEIAQNDKDAEVRKAALDRVAELARKD